MGFLIQEYINVTCKILNLNASVFLRWKVNHKSKVISVLRSLLPIWWMGIPIKEDWKEEIHFERFILLLHMYKSLIFLSPIVPSLYFKSVIKWEINWSSYPPVKSIMLNWNLSLTNCNWGLDWWQWLTALATCPEDPHLILTTPWWLTTICNSGYRGSNAVFWVTQAKGMHVIHRYTYRKTPCTENKINLNSSGVLVKDFNGLQ